MSFVLGALWFVLCGVDAMSDELWKMTRYSNVRLWNDGWSATLSLANRKNVPSTKLPMLFRVLNNLVNVTLEWRTVNAMTFD